MVSYQYSYLILDLLFLIIWLVLFFSRKDLRKELVIMSILFAVVATIIEPLTAIDWWQPLTITNTIPGIESFLFGFVVGGIAAVGYEEIFGKKIREKKETEKQEEKRNLKFIRFGTMGFIIFFILALGFNLNTFLSSIASMVILILWIYSKREDLVINSIVSGIFTLITAFLIYTIAEIITPGWVQEFWLFQNVPEIIFLNLPIDDIVWFFLFGALWGPLYEFWHEKRLTKL